MSDVTGVYSITNIVNGKMYIGSSKHVFQRYREHKKDLNNGTHAGAELQNDWNKYGEDKFEFNLLLETSYADSLKYEREFIEKFHSNQFGYNCNCKKNFATNLRIKAELREKQLYDIIKTTFKFDNNIYSYDFFEIAKEMNMTPTELIKFIGFNKIKSFLCGIEIVTPEGAIYVILTPHEDEMRLDISSDYADKNSQIIIIDEIKKSQ